MPHYILVIANDVYIADEISETLENRGFAAKHFPIQSSQRFMSLRLKDFLERKLPEYAFIIIENKKEVRGFDLARELSKEYDIQTSFIVPEGLLDTLEIPSELEPFICLHQKDVNEENINKSLDLMMHNSAIKSKLAESDEWLSEVHRTAKDCLIIVNNQNMITFMNENAEDLTGFTQQEYLGKHVDKLLKFRDTNNRECPEVCIENMKSSERSTYINALIDKQYREKPISFSMEPLTIHDKVIGRSILVNDLSHIIRVQNEIREIANEVDKSKDAIIVTDIQSYIEHVNPCFTELTGYTLEDVAGKSPRILQSSETSFDDFKSLWKTVTSGEEWSGNILAKRKDGDMFWSSLSIASIKNEEDVISHLICTMEDISDKKNFEEALKDSEQCYRSLADISKETIAVFVAGKLSFINTAGVQLFGADHYRDLLGRNIFSFFHPACHEEVKARVLESLHESKLSELIESRCLDVKGKSIEVELGGSIVNYRGERALQLIIRNITDRKSTAVELKLLTAAIENSVNLIFITDPEGNVVYANSRAQEISGYSLDEIKKFTIREIVASEMTEREFINMKTQLHSGNNWSGVYKNENKDGQHYSVSMLISPITDEKNNVSHFLAVQEDITEKKKTEERIEHLASYDELTGLLNRSKFMQLINTWLHTNRDERATLLLVDVDNFKLFNSSLSHHLGDEFLRIISKCLLEQFKDEDTNSSMKSSILISRLGSDEFSIFLPTYGADEALETAEEIRKKIEDCRLGDTQAQISTSLGLASFPEHGTNRRDLFKKADAALYRAKELGRNICHLYMPEDKYLEEAHSKYLWKTRIVDALKNDQFEIWMQPIMNLKDNQISKYEILVRMRDADGSVLLPSKFIDVAEIFGLIGSIDKIVAEKAMQLQVQTARSGNSHIAFSMNLSGKDLDNEELLEFLRDQIIKTGADPKSLHFEITETAAIRDLDKAISFIKKLKQLGCSFSLDDFGVGFTSFNYLKEMPVDSIKIDGSFIKNLHQSHHDQLFVKAITDVAHGMGIQTIAEFVENEETFRILRDMNVDFGQGYFIGKPSETMPTLPAYCTSGTFLSA